MSPPRSINFTTISQYYFYNKEGWSAAVDLKRIVVGQLPPYNRPQTQGPILILALNTDRSRRWSNAGEWRIDQLAALSPRHAAAFLVCSTFQPTKNQTFITLRHVRRCNIYIYMRFCSTCTLLCSLVFAIERMAKLQCWSIPFDRCCIYTRFNLHARVKYRSVLCYVYPSLQVLLVGEEKLWDKN